MNEEKEIISEDLHNALKSGAGSVITKVALAGLSGIPGWGILFGLGGSSWSEADQAHFKKVLKTWLKLQEDEIKEIGKTLVEVMIRVDHTDEKVRERIESQEYLSLIKKCFRDWNAAESEKKRILLRNLLANAASCKLTSDDVVRLFIEWIGQYSEIHFSIIACVHQNQGITRWQMWQQLYGQEVREDSAEADLFKLVVNNLTLGYVIRQEREVSPDGQYYKKTRPSNRNRSPFMATAFDDEKGYELTSLGRQFVHYTMNELVPKIAYQAPSSQSQ